MQILDEISDEVSNLLTEGDVVCDLFSGSGTVAYRLAQRNVVYANDVQEYSKVISNVLLQVNKDNGKQLFTYHDVINTDYYKSNKEKLYSIFETAVKYEKDVLDTLDYNGLAELCELNLYYDGTEIPEEKKTIASKIFGEAMQYFSIENINKLKENKSVYALFTLYYINSYFSLSQCIEIDSIRCAIDKVYENSEIGEYEYNLLIACLIHAVSEVVSSVGKNFAQPMRVTDKNGDIKDFAIRRCMRDRKLQIRPFFENIYEKLLDAKISYTDNKVFCDDAMNLLSKDEMKEVTLFYLDPPYTIDHYSRFYHVLETLVKYDYPNLERKKLNGRMRIMNGRYRDDRYQSNYCIPSKGASEFDQLIKKIHELGAKVVLSYSDDDSEKDTRKRVVSRSELVSILERYYDDVQVKNIEHRYRKLSAKDDNRKEKNNSELLIICK